MEDTSNPTPRTPTRSSRTAGRRARASAVKPDAKRIALIAGAVAAGLLVLAVGLDLLLSAGRVHPGVSVGEVAVGRMKPAAAAEAIERYVAERSASPVTIHIGEASWVVERDQIGLSVDATGLAESAYAVGRGEFGPAVLGRLRALAGKADVPLALGYEEAGMAAVLDAIDEAVSTPPVDAGVEVDGTAVTRTEPADGFGVPRETAREAVLTAFVSEGRDVTLTLVPLPPLIDTEDAEGAYESARVMVSAPLVLHYGEKEWQVAPSVIGDWIGFRVAGEGDEARLETYVIAEEVDAAVLPMVTEVGRPAKNAIFNASAGKVTIVPSEDGLAADPAELAATLDAVLTRAEDRRAELTMHRVAPEITTEKAQSMGIVERISTFTTTFAASNVPRVNNIHTLADELDGTLIAPGDTFSFNEAIGERTAAKGYQEANAIVNGKLVPQLGGGICQVGTTIFNTVFFSGLPVVERRNHSLYISSYPTGRDATISWGGADFKFKNDTGNWLLVAAGYTGSSVTISLYGTSPGYEVSYETGPWTNVIDPPVREVKDPELPQDSRVIEERGSSGRTVIVTRTVRKAGAVIRTDSFKSVYRPAEEVVRVGTMPVASTPATTTP